MTTDSQRKLMEMRDARLGVSVEDALAEIEALTAPADEPAAVAEFARTPETRQALGDVLPPDQLAELEHDLERQEAFASIYQPASTPPDSALVDLARRTAKELKADATANGFTAQRNRERDQHRAGPGREARNAKQRGDYASIIFETEGRKVRSYEKATEERRRQQKAASKANRSPAQIERERILDKESKARRRADAKAAKAAALKDGARF